MEKKDYLIMGGSVLLATVIIIFTVMNLQTPSVREWFNKPVSNINLGDILIVVIAGAFMSRK